MKPRRLIVATPSASCAPSGPPDQPLSSYTPGVARVNSESGRRWIKSMWASAQGRALDLAFDLGRQLVKIDRLGEDRISAPQVTHIGSRFGMAGDKDDQLIGLAELQHVGQRHAMWTAGRHVDVDHETVRQHAAAIRRGLRRPTRRPP